MNRNRLQNLRGIAEGSATELEDGKISEWQTVGSKSRGDQSVSNLPTANTSRRSVSAWETNQVGNGSRRHPSEARTNGPIPARSIAARGGSSIAGNMPRPSDRRALAKSEYRAGMIIGAFQVDRDRDQRKGVTMAAQSRTNNGTVVFEKERKFIVLDVFFAHVVVVPIYTYVGAGLEKRQEEKNEYVSIQELNFKAKAAPAESDHPLLWCDATPEWKNSGRAWGRMSDTAVIHFTCPLRHLFSNPSQILGNVTEESLSSLRKLYATAFSHSSETQSEPTTAEISGAEQEPRSDSAPAALPSRTAQRSVAPAIPRSVLSASTVGPTRSPPRNNGRNAPY